MKKIKFETNLRPRPLPPNRHPHSVPPPSVRAHILQPPNILPHGAPQVILNRHIGQFGVQP